jgi:phage gp36-like protein
MRRRLPARDLAQLTDEENGAEIQDDALDAALQDASDEVDGYLHARYPLPLAHVPGNLIGYVCNIALYNLLRLRPMGDLEDARNRYEDALKYLAGVASGRNHLALPRVEEPGEQVPAPAAPAVLFTSAPRVFSRERMRGW